MDERETSLDEIERRKPVAKMGYDLRQLFEPQFELLAMERTARRCGMAGSVGKGHGEGSAWVAPVGDHCLLTVLDLSLARSTLMESTTAGYACIGVMSPASVATMPEARHCESAHGLIGYRQGPGRHPYHLAPRETYASRSLTFTPRFFDALAATSPEAAELIFQDMGNPRWSLACLPLKPLFDGLSVQSADGFSTEFRLNALLNGTVALLLEEAEAALSARDRAESTSSRKLVAEARALMEQHLGESLTLDRIARDLCVSRSALAATFKEETGRGVAEELRGMRMARAAQRLECGDEPLAAIARAVGYPRPSSFATAFKREYGRTPSQWREGMRPQASQRARDQRRHPSAAQPTTAPLQKSK